MPQHRRLHEITLSNHRREDFLKFERGIQEIPQLLNCFWWTGGYDYLRSSSPRTSTTTRTTVESLSTATWASTSNSATSLKQVKRNTGFPLADLVEQPDSYFSEAMKGSLLW